MSIDLKNLPKPPCFSHMSDEEYHPFAEQSFAEMIGFAEDGSDFSDSAEWVTAVIAAMATKPNTIALPLETIEMLIEVADNSIRDKLGNASDREKELLGQSAYAYMRATGVWLDLKTVNPPKEVEVSDRVKI